MPIAMYLLALYVFLQSAPVFSWFTVDPKFTAFVGLVFVALVVVEGVLWYRGQHPFWHRNTPAA